MLPTPTLAATVPGASVDTLKDCVRDRSPLVLRSRSSSKGLFTLTHTRTSTSLSSSPSGPGSGVTGSQASTLQLGDSRKEQVPTLRATTRKHNTTINSTLAS